MAEEEYELLANKMREIAEIIKEFPENLQEKVFHVLIHALSDSFYISTEEIDKHITSKVVVNL